MVEALPITVKGMAEILIQQHLAMLVLIPWCCTSPLHFVQLSVHCLCHIIFTFYLSAPKPGT